jgi:hypothetical protein
MYRKAAAPSRIYCCACSSLGYMTAISEIWILMIVSKKAMPEAKLEVVNSALRSGSDYALLYDVEAEVEFGRRERRWEYCRRIGRTLSKG